MNENNTQNEIPNVNSKGKEERNVPDLGKKYFVYLKDISMPIEYGLGASAIEFDGNNIYVRITDIDDETSEFNYTKLSSPSFFEDKYLLQNGDILIARTGASVGKSYLHNDISNAYFAGFLMRVRLLKHNPYYIYAQFKTTKFKKWLQIMSIRSGQPGINSKELGLFKVYIADKDEEEKIGNILRTIDLRIATQKKIICLLESQINQIRNTLINTIEKQHSFILFGDIIEEYKEKTTANNMYPVLSSTKSGIHLQSEYFNKEAASDDTTGYKIIPRGYCAYRSMSDTGEFTFNVQNIIETGIVSPAYPVFTTKYNNEFIIEYLNNSTKLRNNILSLKEGGTRFALSLKKLMTLEIPKISIDEQKNFIDLVNKFNNKIKNEKQILSLYEKQKQYLLDKLFI